MYYQKVVKYNQPQPEYNQPQPRYNQLTTDLQPAYNLHTTQIQLSGGSAQPLYNQSSQIAC